MLQTLYPRSLPFGFVSVSGIGCHDTRIFVVLRATALMSAGAVVGSVNKQVILFLLKLNLPTQNLNYN